MSLARHRSGELPRRGYAIADFLKNYIGSELDPRPAIKGQAPCSSSNFKNMS